MLLYICMRQGRVVHQGLMGFLSHSTSVMVALEKYYSMPAHCLQAPASWCGIPTVQPRKSLH